MRETKEVLVYSCGYCGKLYREKEQADFCHADRTCGTCGKVIGKLDYYVDCEDCRNKKELQKQQELFDKARKMTLDEYIKEFPEHLLTINDIFFDADDDLEYSFEESPKWVFGTKEIIEKLDAYDIVERFEESVELEDFQLGKVEIEEIKEFCNKWNDKHAVTYYCEDTSIVVLLDDLTIDK